jgi:putative membrane protein
LAPPKQETIMMNSPNWSAGWNHGHFGVHVVMHLVWYAAIIGLAALVVTYMMRRSRSDSGYSGALDVLKERYARGELSKDDFDRMRQDILV